MKASPNEKELLIALKNGNQDAFDTIYDKWSGYVYNFIFKTLYNKSLAEDLTQELFLKMWECRNQIDVENNFQAWIFTIARNLVYKEGRKMILNSAFMEESSTEAKDHEYVTDNMVDFSFTNEYIDTLIESMPPARRKIYRMRKNDGFSIREIALRLGLSEKTVETQLYHANQFMRQHFKSMVLCVALLSICSRI